MKVNTNDGLRKMLFCLSRQLFLEPWNQLKSTSMKKYDRKQKQCILKKP